MHTVAQDLRLALRGLRGSPAFAHVAVAVIALGVGAVSTIFGAAGRFFAPGEGRTPLTHPVAVISHRLWQSRFAGDPAVVGRAAVRDGRPFTLVGVAPPASAPRSRSVPSRAPGTAPSREGRCAT